MHPVQLISKPIRILDEGKMVSDVGSDEAGPRRRTERIFMDAMFELLKSNHKDRDLDAMERLSQVARGVPVSSKIVEHLFDACVRLRTMAEPRREQRAYVGIREATFHATEEYGYLVSDNLPNSD
jgi:hypothetical protein